MIEIFLFIICVILFLLTLSSLPYIVCKFYKMVNYLLTKSVYKNYLLFFVCGLFAVDSIYSAYFGFGVVNTDPISIYERITYIFIAIFFAAIALQSIVKNAYFKSKLDQIIKLFHL